MNEIAPVFLVGPVRSGSTFLRLMLDSHPNITNPGECDFLFDLVDDEGRYPEMSAYHRFLSINRIFLGKRLKIDSQLSYRELMRSFLEQFHRDNATLIMNLHRHFHRVPFIFPNARYIHLLRDPRDVARSCIGMGWVGHVYYGVDIWTAAEQSWDKLKASLGRDQYLEIKYEDLLDDIEAGLARICKFVGLEYSGQMLDYDAKSTYAKPDKNLSYQWKKKYSKRELQLVEGKIGSMLAARGYEPSGLKPASPGVIERVSLAIRNKGFRVRHDIRRYGLGLYLGNFISARLRLRSLHDACQMKKNLIDLQYLK